MSAITNINSGAKTVFCPPTKLLKTSDTLLRLAMLDHALIPSSRSQKLQTLTTLWKEALQQKEASVQEIKNNLSAGLKKLDLVIPSIYISALSSVTTYEVMQKHLIRYLKDAKSVPITPMRKSQRGNQGPTFLVSYPRPSGEDKIKHHTYVLKWTDWNELASTRLYTAFSKEFSKEGSENLLGCFVPTIAILDFKRQVHETTDGIQNSLTQDLLLQLKNRFLKLSSVQDSKLIPKSEQLMLSERICGENLFDFALKKYQYLNSTQKMALFQYLGRLSVLDLLTGNLDRFVKVIHDLDDAYVLEDIEANLFNVMIEWDPQGKKDPVLYAIDNGIDPDLIQNAECKKKYLTFLKNLLTSKDLEKLLAKNIIGSFQSAIEMQPEDMEGNINEIKRQLKPFSSDLPQVAFPAFQEGIKEMMESFEKVFIPAWESEKKSFIKKYLSSNFPELFASVNERFKLFKSIRKSL